MDEEEIKSKILRTGISKEAILELYLKESGLLKELAKRLPDDFTKEQVKFSVEFTPQKKQEFWESDKRLGVTKTVIHRGRQQIKNIPSMTREIETNNTSKYRETVDKRVKELTKDNTGLYEE